jgi:hypothetical protein
MSRPTKTDQERGYLRSFWTEIRTLEADYVGSVTIQAYASARPGVFVFRVTFVPFLHEEANPLGTSSVQVEYPNGATQTMAGALWAASMKLTTLVYEDAEKRGARPGKRA